MSYYNPHRLRTNEFIKKLLKKETNPKISRKLRIEQRWIFLEMYLQCELNREEFERRILENINQKNRS